MEQAKMHARINQLHSMEIPSPTEDILPAAFRTEENKKYLEDYAERSDKCICCGRHLSVNWSIVHGQSYCYHCGDHLSASQTK